LEVEALLRDTLNLLRVYRIPITSHALHIYHSASVTAPECALTRLAFLQLKDIARLFLPRAKGWGPDVRVFEGHEATLDTSVSSVAFLPDRKHIVSGSDDTSIRIWDAQTDTQRLLLKGHAVPVESVTFTADGKQIVSGSGDSTVRIWDTQTGIQRALFEGHTGQVTSVAISANGERIVSGSYDGTVRIWEVKTGAQLNVLMDCETEDNTVLSVALSPDGRHVASGSHRRDVVIIWDVQTVTQRALFEGHWAGVSSVAYSLDGKRIVSGSYDRSVRVWDAQTGIESALLEGHTGSVLSVAFSEDGQ
jgi:WD40 repeat protein